MSGLVSILFGFVLFLYPGIGGVAVIWAIGVYARLFGALLVFLGLKLRNLESPV